MDAHNIDYDGCFDECCACRTVFPRSERMSQKAFAAKVIRALKIEGKAWATGTYPHPNFWEQRVAWFQEQAKGLIGELDVEKTKMELSFAKTASEQLHTQ